MFAGACRPAFAISILLIPSALAAQESTELRTIVLRSTEGVDDRTASEVDRVLLAELREAAGIDTPTVSPIGYEEIAAAAGCARADSSCLGTVAQTLEDDAVLLRVLQARDGGGRILLVYQDRGGATVTAERRYAASGDREQRPGEAAEPASLVPSMVRELFGIPEMPALGAHRGVDEPVDGVGVATWMTLGAAAASLSAGIVLGAMSDGAQADYEAIEVETRADADRAARELETAEDRALAANVLFAAGGVLATAGIILLLSDLEGSEDEPAASVAAAPGGGMVLLQGRWGSP